MVRPLSLGIALAGLCFAAPAALANDPSGTWLSEDGRARIRMEMCGASADRLCGYVVWLQQPKGEDGTPRLDPQNPDASKRSRPALGIQLIEGLKLNADNRYEGQIYNADNGKRYDVTVWSDAPGELNLRGCLVRYLCKTQDWKQVRDVAPGQLTGLTGAPGGPRPEPAWAVRAPAGGPAVATRKAVPTDRPAAR